MLSLYIVYIRSYKGIYLTGTFASCCCTVRKFCKNAPMTEHTFILQHVHLQKEQYYYYIIDISFILLCMSSFCKISSYCEQVNAQHLSY